MITVNDLIELSNQYIGDSSNDRVGLTERLSAITEATAWLLEELGNEHMTDRVDIEYLPTVRWYKMNSLSPYLLTAGQLRFKNELSGMSDFTRIEARDLASMTENRTAYAIERYNDDAFMGIVVPKTANIRARELLKLNSYDNLTYTGVNAINIAKTIDYVSFDMNATGLTATGLRTTTVPQGLLEYQGTGVIVFDVEIPDMTDVTGVSLKFGTNLSTDYWLGVVTQDIYGDPLKEGMNTIKISFADMVVVGTPDVNGVTEWELLVNHLTTKPLAENFRLSDLRIVKPLDLTFKYIFYRVGKNNTGDDIIEFGAVSDVPFFAERYPQYKFAVAHKAASRLFKGMTLYENARDEERDAFAALSRYRKNFSGERDMPNSTFKPHGINFRSRRIIKRR